MTEQNPPAPPSNDPPAPPPSNDPPSGDRLSVLEKSVETLTELVKRVLPTEDKPPTKKPWIYWGGRS